MDMKIKYEKKDTYIDFQANGFLSSAHDSGLFRLIVMNETPSLPEESIRTYSDDDNFSEEFQKPEYSLIRNVECAINMDLGTVTMLRDILTQFIDEFSKK